MMLTGVGQNLAEMQASVIIMSEGLSCPLYFCMVSQTAAEMCIQEWDRETGTQTQQIFCGN